jgi:deoxyribodipyrimidine photolyase
MEIIFKCPNHPRKHGNHFIRKLNDAFCHECYVKLHQKEAKENISVDKKECFICVRFYSGQDETYEVFKKFYKIMKSHKDAYKKKVALFNCVKDIKIEDLEPLEKKRIDYLLQSRLYNELAKQSMREYKKLTVEDYSKER